MQLIDICGILVVVIAIFYAVYRIFLSKKPSCGCGGKKCSKPKHYTFKEDK